MINRIKNSIIARTNIWESKHFHLTSHGKKIARYKNTHNGERCFVIGNGPSLSASDLQVLHENNVVTFGTNRVFQIFDKTQWRPTYYASEDATVLQSVQADVVRIPCKERFLPINLKWDKIVEVPNAAWFYLDYNSEYPDTYGLALDVAKGIRCRSTITTTCIQLAIYMGFSEIYLLGVDHNYSKYIDSTGKLVEDPTVKDYFSDAYDDDFKTIIGRDLGETTLSYISVEKLSQKTGKFKVFNATRGGKLEVFQRVDFDSLFK